MITTRELAAFHVASNDLRAMLLEVWRWISPSARPKGWSLPKENTLPTLEDLARVARPIELVLPVLHSKAVRMVVAYPVVDELPAIQARSWHEVAIALMANLEKAWAFHEYPRLVSSLEEEAKLLGPPPDEEDKRPRD